MYITDYQLKRIVAEAEGQSIKRNQELVESLNAVIHEQKLTGQIAVIEQQKQILAHIYEKAAAYTNLIMVGGYAGLFAVWQFTRHSLSTTVTLFIAVLAMTSLICFVGFEVYKNVTTSLFLLRLGRVISSHVPEQDRIEAWQLAVTGHATRQAKLWPFFLIPTVTTGFIAGVVLLIALLFELFLASP